MVCRTGSGLRVRYAACGLRLAAVGPPEGSCRVRGIYMLSQRQLKLLTMTLAVGRLAKEEENVTAEVEGVRESTRAAPASSSRSLFPSSWAPQPPSIGPDVTGAPSWGSISHSPHVMASRLHTNCAYRYLYLLHRQPRPSFRLRGQRITSPRLPSITRTTPNTSRNRTGIRGCGGKH